LPTRDPARAYLRKNLFRGGLKVTSILVLRLVGDQRGSIGGVGHSPARVSLATDEGGKTLAEMLEHAWAT